MKSPQRISDSEWQVMRVIWECPGLHAIDIHSRLDASLEWSQKTVNTFLARLEKKLVIRSEKIGRMKHYHPEVSEEECQQAESSQFLEKVFRGNAGMALLHFAENEELSDEEVQKLREIIDKSSKS
ncbi:MAG: BlaI/MecI/CopY family transcriptional regulator [Opitutales bacterium]|nr:BlaI/MecI/CopY family transcriptional regulator [Opitutales bacterium]